MMFSTTIKKDKKKMNKIIKKNIFMNKISEI